MENLRDFLLVKFRNDEIFQAWKRKFPDMFAFSENITVIPWSDEYGIADKNPEALDELEFYDELRKNGLISNEEFEAKLRDIHIRYGTVSRTEGVAWIERKEVSFRKKNPNLSTVLHELGHVYFEENDPVWSNIYGGGELLMWLIIKDKAEGNEESIKIWHTLMHLAYEKPSELLGILDEKAERVALKVGIDLGKVKKLDITDSEFCKNHAIGKLMLWIGTIPGDDAESHPQPVLINILEGVRWGEYLYSVLLEELLNK